MKRTASFSYVFICVIVSIGAASAALLESSSVPSLAVPLDASLQQKVKWKIVEVYKYKFRPTHKKKSGGRQRSIRENVVEDTQVS
ncbi:unnamed protein product [Closterium sp. Yama58-4]|nr:unnamed protein product [Closterium sp. Yama58-4]